MSPDFLRKSHSREEEEKRKLVADALGSMFLHSPTAESTGESPGRGKLLRFPGNANRYERMSGLLADTRDPSRAERATIFLKDWGDLASEMRAARNANRRAMAAQGNWDFPDLIQNDWEFVRILAGLRWMALRYRVGFAPDCAALSALVHQGLTFVAIP